MKKFSLRKMLIKGQDNQVFELYKPFRNHLRKISLPDSLYVLWVYTQHLQFNNPIPSSIEVLPEIVLAKNKISKTFFEWELETLVREVIINSEESKFAPETLRKWKYFARAINKLKDLENKIIKKFIDETNILTEFHRIAHREFPWQSSPNQKYIARYFKIFNYTPLNNIIQSVIGLTTQELFLIGMLLFGFYKNKFALFTPPTIIDIPEITQESLDKIFNHFSCDLIGLKKKLLGEQQINEKFVYAYSSLRKYPIIKMKYQGKDSLVCPLPTLLVWRLTNGIYYEICGKKNFSNEFGKSFQNYVGEVIERGNNKVEAYPEEEYLDGKDRKDTVDWIIDEGDSAIFIECKTKRITVPAKTEIKSEKELKKDLEFMADFIVQVYKSIGDYFNNKYPSFKFRINRKIFPLIVTLEDWYLWGDKLLGELKTKVIEKLRKTSLPLAWLSEMPYSVCSIQDFELMVQIMEKVGIKKFIEKKVYDQDKEKWGFRPFIINEFPNENKILRFLFPDDFDKIFPKRFFEQGIKKPSEH